MKVLFSSLVGECNVAVFVYVVCFTACDYITPLCSQVTYEGLLDDTFGINSGLCFVSSMFTIM